MQAFTHCPPPFIPFFSLSPFFFFAQTHMLQRTLFKFKACVSKALGCLYHCFRQKGQLLGDRENIWGKERGGDRSRVNERERMRRESRARKTEGEGGDREGESKGDKGRREGGGTIARFQLPFVGLSADVTSCSPARRVPERGTSPPATSSATFQVSIRQEGFGGVDDWGVEDRLREAGERGDFGKT